MASNSEIIKELKKHLKDKRLSVIIGAGFSKNASNEYLNWKELLRDMIIEMYGNNSKLSSPKKDQLVEKIISEKGYLSVASDYVRRRGYHEAIDEYIESRTPIIKRDGDDYSVILNEEKLNKKVDLSIHKLLLSFEWNNVYTFNYDNLLEIATDTDKNDEIEKQIIKCQEEIIELSNKKAETEREIAKLDDKNPDDQNITATLFTSDTSSKKNYTKDFPTENEYIVHKEPEENKDKKNDLQKDIDKLKIEIETNENKIESLRREQKDLYMLVDSAFKISLRKAKNIYKLHGNIRSDRSRKYGFDCDPRCHYIITQEDYDSYREKHDAFVSLMRIALLQDYFCLIGFSGDDPNFLSWISWVKDILDQRVLNENSSNKNINDAKIFFIDVSGIPLDKGKEQFFKNHYIKHVSLFDTKPADGSIIKRGVNDFLQSLKNEKYKAIKAIEDYNSFWKTNVFSKKENTNDYVLGYKRSDIRLVWESLHYNRLPKLKTYVCYNRRYVISSLEKYIEKQTVDEDVAKLFMMAVKGELLPIDEVIDDKDLEKFVDSISNYGDLMTVVQNSRMRYTTLINKVDLDDIKDLTLDESKYESILRRLFNLDFSEAINLIDKWNPREIRWRVIRLSLKKIMGIVKDDDIPQPIDLDSLEYNNQELLYSLQTLEKLIKFRGNYKEKLERINRQIYEIKETALKEPAFNNLDDNIENLTNKLKEQKINISSYGDNRISFNFGGDMLLVYSIQLLQYFIDTGLPLCTPFVIYYSKDNWYLAFKKIYEMYPAPCLFYSLQFGNEKYYIRRIAQDYVYSNRLRTFCEEVLLKMLRAYRMAETPKNIKNSILLAAPIFFSYVQNDIWQADFESIYNESDLSDRNKNKRDVTDPLDDFLIAGVEYSKREPFLRQVLYKEMKRCEKINDVDNEMIIAAKKNLIIGKQSKELKESIDVLIHKSNSIPNYFVLFNLQTILTLSQKSLFLKKKLLQYDYTMCLDPNMIMASLEFGKDNKDNPLVKKIEAEIIENPMLWRNGIERDKTGKYNIIAQTYHLPLHSIQKLISFSPQTIEKIYVKMKDSLHVIMQYHDDNRKGSFSEIINSGDVILEMIVFLEKNRSLLNKLPKFYEISKKVESMHNNFSRFNSIIDALVSTDAKIVNKGISQLSYKVQYLGFNNFTTEYLVIANIILKKCSSGLSNSVFHFSDIIKSHFPKVDKMLFEPIIRKILDVYQPYFSDINCQWDLDVRKEMVENAMIDLNNVLKKWGESSPFWNNYKRLFSI